MKDIIIGNYTISGVPNSSSFVLRENKTDKNGKQYTNNLAYTATLNQAIESYADHKLANTDMDVFVVLDEIQQQLDKIYTKYNIKV